MINKEHLTEIGFNRLLSIKSVFSKGLSDTIKEIYPDVIPIEKPQHKVSSSLLDPYWITGFVQADGSFSLGYSKNNRRKLGYSIQPMFRVTQHERDLIVLQRIIETLGCGKLFGPYSGRDRYDISILNLKDITDIIIPFFIKYPMYGAKSLDFNSFCLGVSIILRKEHLTKEGLDKLKDLAYSMNTFIKD